jgi:hypothetical protein
VARTPEGSTGIAVSNLSRSPRSARLLAASGTAAVGVAVLLIAAGLTGASPVARTISIQADGASPPEASITATLTVPNWHNTDEVEHNVTFRNGRCSLELQPSGRGTCSDAFWRYVGRYPYTVSGVRTPDATLVVEPAQRALTLYASRTLLARGSTVALTGTLTFATPIAPPELGQPVALMHRILGAKRFVPLKTLRTHLRRSGSVYEWRATVRPRATTTYRARDFFQPRGGVVWRDVQSRAVTVRVR